MAFPHPPGLLPTEIAFLCEMELITVLPRQRLERLDLLGGPTNALMPPQRTNLPLWLALLLKRQKRANILPPPWLHPDALSEILDLETTHFKDSFSPPPTLPPTKNDSLGSKNFQPSYPFVPSSTADSPADSLPYHYLELSSMLLEFAADDLMEPDTIRRLLQDLREVRMAKLRKGVEVLSGEGEGVRLDGVGAMEVGEQGAFVRGVVDNLRKLGGSREQARREERASQKDRGGRNQDYNDDDEEEDDEMG